MTTRLCSALPPSHCSQKQPPASGTRLMFAALPDHVWSLGQYRSGCTSTAQASAGAALISKRCSKIAPSGDACLTSAPARAGSSAAETKTRSHDRSFTLYSTRAHLDSRRDGLHVRIRPGRGQLLLGFRRFVVALLRA